ncbi:MAG TPA: glycosyltransferase family 87 protein [Bryobacterales bacterium]|nr:glycosyltransferase family 87 protein [Bryobacterales bacterium]
MNRWVDKAIISAVGLTLMFIMGMSGKDVILSGKNDFAPLYNGTQLLGTPYLYSAEHNYALLEEHVGGTNDSLRYTRLPYHAALFWPLGKLPYLTAYAIWVVVCLSALVGFVILWTIPSRPDAMAFTALSLPAFQSLMNGQDTPLLLLWVALAVRLYQKDREFAAGCVLALCASKYHLFALVPVLLLAQRRWGMLRGLAASGTVLMLLSFAVSGWSWPLDYIATLADGRVHPEPSKMPNLHGLLRNAPLSFALQMALTAAIVVSTWFAAKRTSFVQGLALALSGGLLISYHAYLSDCALLLPAAMIVYAQIKNRWVQVFAALLLTPFLYMFILAPPPASYVVQFAIMGFFTGTAYWALRQAPLVQQIPGSRLSVRGTVL